MNRSVSNLGQAYFKTGVYILLWILIIFPFPIFPSPLPFPFSPPLPPHPFPIFTSFSDDSLTHLPIRPLFFKLDRFCRSKLFFGDFAVCYMMKLKTCHLKYWSEDLDYYLKFKVRLWSRHLTIMFDIKVCNWSLI